MSKDIFLIHPTISKCDCCGYETHHDDENYALSTNNEIRIGMVLCSYCILMLKYKVNEFDEEQNKKAE
jgi:hypothetical protein